MLSRFVVSLRRALTITALIAAGWAVAVFLTGGFAFDLFGLSISSRNPRNPAMLAGVCGALAAVLPGADRRRAAREVVRRWRALVARGNVVRPPWLDLAAGIALIGAALQLLAWHGARPLWLDEEMIALNVRDRSLAQLPGPLWFDQTAPLGWLAIQRLVLVTFGTGDRTVRSIAALFGVATLVVATWAGRRWLAPLPAAAFVLLCSVGSWIAHYPLELKPYSSDAFWALLLPTLAVWVVEGRTAEHQLRRARAWWGLAAVAHWFGNGGILVVPGCAALLLIGLWRSAGWRAVMEMLAGGALLLASFAVHFALSIRHTLASHYLRSYWSGGLPPEASGLVERITWVGAQLEPLARNPVGTERALLFWLVVSVGCLVAPARVRWALVLVPLSAFILGALGIVPLLDRVALWIVPVLYFAIGFATQRALRLLAGPHFLLGAALSVATFLVCTDVVVRGWRGVESRWVSDRNHGLDDRSAVRWLVAQRRPGDVLVTTQMALPAVWWYGELPLDAHIVEAAHVPPEECAAPGHRETLSPHTRALVYVGFPDAPNGFADLLLRELSGTATGAVVADRTFADTSRAAIVELAGQGRPPAAEATGCVRFQLARAW